MWLVPFNSPGPSISVDFGRDTYIQPYITIYNYNKSEEDSIRGVREVVMYVDGNYVGHRVIRKAPGMLIFSSILYII